MAGQDDERFDNDHDNLAEGPSDAEARLRRCEAERTELEERLRYAHRTVAIGRLARGIAHDFNNVLAAILGTADLLAMRKESDDSVREDADEIRKAAERGAALARQLLAVSSAPPAEPKLLDLNHAVRRWTERLQRALGHAATLDVRTGRSKTMVRVDASLLEEALINLVNNAIDSMPGRNGVVFIEVEPLTVSQETGAESPELPDGPYVCLRVKDTGTGIAPHVQPRVFQPFFTTKDPSRAMGVGLPVVQATAREAGGIVRFSSRYVEPNRGSTFEIVLPVAVT